VPELNGVLVVEVVPNTPAAEADIRQCDLILYVDGELVQNPTEVQLAVDRGEVGQPMQLKLRRDGDEISVEVLPKELPRRN
jgi:S1-C subfamily serine protease